MNDILIHEVGPRDGLQIEKTVVPTGKKIEWVTSLIRSGVDMIQLGSFVNPERVPQMADTEELFLHFNHPGNRPQKTRLAGLVLNEKGLDRGLACGVDFFCMGVSASDTHSRKNTGAGTEESIGKIIGMAKRAIAAGKDVQVSVQSAFGCGFEGEVPESRVLRIVGRFIDSGLYRVSLADTAGHANPMQVERLFGEVLALAPEVECACHFHDTYGLALANVWAAMKSGVRWFESGFAGIGGCPFTAMTAGNVCTEDFVHMLQRMGLRRDVAIEPLIAVAKEASAFFARPLPGVVHRTGVIAPKLETVQA